MIFVKQDVVTRNRQPCQKSGSSVVAHRFIADEITVGSHHHGAFSPWPLHHHRTILPRVYRFSGIIPEFKIEL